MHTTHTVLMVRPDHFGFNPQTAETNTFQHKPTLSEQEVQQRARDEFDAMVQTLQKRAVTVLVMPSRTDTITPDAVFPNNWFSHHEGNTLVVYPMLAPNRRSERQLDVLIQTLNTVPIPPPTVVDLTELEESGGILEGTGSMVLDRTHKIAYAMESPRTTRFAFDEWCERLGYEGLFFHAYDGHHVPIYHTNVLMSVGEEFAVVCFESIQSAEEQTLVRKKIEQTKKECIEITMDQMNMFCGNILQLRSQNSESCIVLSESAYNAFTPVQRTQLEAHGSLIPVAIPTIESVGGGSARCMMAEIFTG